VSWAPEETSVVAANPWVRQFAPARAGAPCLACFPHAGGSASFFAPLAELLSPAIRVLAVQYPGRLERRAEPVVADIGELARRAVGVPVAYFGHSMGSLVAFEGARVAEPGPTMIFASGGQPPARTSIDPLMLHSDESLIDHVATLGATDRQALQNADLRALVLPALRGDYQALYRYAPRPGARVSCPITVLTGDRDPLVSPGEAERWRDHTTGRFRSEVLPGGHFYLNERLADVAAVVLAEVRGKEMSCE
jgi:surfactin synthase thioesterase subunit